jgi:indole-3-glycerol phosphate synthase
MTILEQIVASKKTEVEMRKAFAPASHLEKSLLFQEKRRSLKNHLLDIRSSGIIAEFKRKSPSAGIINGTALAGIVCSDYSAAGCSAVSVLTDTDYFGGSSDDLSEVKKNVTCPVLRKDFIIDEYQIIEARSIGADAILLIAEIHNSKRLAELYRFAQSLELDALIEVHDEINFSRIPADAQIVGINSRNLASFSVDLSQLDKLIKMIPENAVKVAESGIRSVSDYMNLKNAGFDAFLIGEYFMRTPDPGKTCKSFIESLGELKSNEDSSTQSFRL